MRRFTRPVALLALLALVFSIVLPAMAAMTYDRITVTQALQTSSAGMVGVGRYNATATITAGATKVLVPTLNPQVQYYDFDAGSTTYTYNIDLSKTKAFPGAVWWIFVDKAASTNPTIKIRNGAGGSDLVSLNNSSAEKYALVFTYTGTNWVLFLGCKNTL